MISFIKKTIKLIRGERSYCCNAKIYWKASEDGEYYFPFCNNCDTICIKE